MWPSTSGLYPKTIVTDSDAALINALEVHFSESSKILCKVHIKRNFRTMLLKYFDNNEHYDSLEKALNFIIVSGYENKKTRISEVTDKLLYKRGLSFSFLDKWYREKILICIKDYLDIIAY